MEHATDQILEILAEESLWLMLFVRFPEETELILGDQSVERIGLTGLLGEGRAFAIHDEEDDSR